MFFLLAAAALAFSPDVNVPIDWAHAVTENEMTCQTFVPTVEVILRLEVGISMPADPDARTLAETIASVTEPEKRVSWTDLPFEDGTPILRPVEDVPPGAPADLAATGRWLELDVGDGLRVIPGAPHLLCFGASRAYGAHATWIGNEPGSYADGAGGSTGTRDMVFRVYGYGGTLQATRLEVTGESTLADVSASGTVSAANLAVPGDATVGDLVVTGTVDLGPGFSMPEASSEPTHLDPYGLFGQVLAQATCAALRQNAGATFAVRRTCPSTATCATVCSQASAGSCIESLHVYPKDAAPADAVKGLQVHRYDSCSAKGCGPNYCCCAP